ncbi:hypothetical protein LJC07_04795 [Christensenellaceae bacterium OttesenSCG-928-L17]|nr:hypothetical protein [Christensenellaceae bacterium OttesenSCG-928-L17]
MAYSGTLLRISGQAIVGLKQYRVSYSKLWKDAERNMNGDVRASMIGVFPKLELEFIDGLTEDQISNLCNLLDQSYFSVTYFDPKTKGTITAQYYASDYAIDMLDKRRGLYKAFTVNLVPVSRR